MTLLYHGALVTVHNFSYHSDMPFGGYYQGMLDSGYEAVEVNQQVPALSERTL